MHAEGNAKVPAATFKRAGARWRAPASCQASNAVRQVQQTVRKSNCNSYVYTPRPMLPAGRRSCRRAARIVQAASALAARGHAAVTYLARSLDVTDDLACLCAESRAPGDAFLLRGSVGAGKSAWCRAFVRHACADEVLAVPSPTYVLQNEYEGADGDAVSHLDLYRLAFASPHLLDLEGARARGVALVEWPERLPDPPAGAIDVRLTVLSAVRPPGSCCGSRHPDARTNQDVDIEPAPRPSQAFLGAVRIAIFPIQITRPLICMTRAGA